MRIFADLGSEKFKALILEMSSYRISEVPTNLISELQVLVHDNTVSSPIHGDIKNIESMYKRIDMAKFFWNKFSTDSSLYMLRNDPNLWNWISAAYLLSVFGSKNVRDIKTKIGGNERWVLTQNSLRYHRHLVSGPYFAYEANQPDPSKAMCQLASAVLDPGELVERVSGKRDLSTGNVCYLATLLYFDDSTQSLRPGHTSPPGNPKAFSRFFSQLDRTLDYESLPIEKLINLLPENFNKWKKMALDQLDRRNKL
jgi:hypothetical protein